MNWAGKECMALAALFSVANGAELKPETDLCLARADAHMMARMQRNFSLDESEERVQYIHWAGIIVSPIQALPLIWCNSGCSLSDAPGERSIRKDSGVQKAESGSAVHLPFDHFEPVNLSFDLTVTPGTFDGGPDCLYVSLKPECKRHQRSDTGKLSNLNPGKHLLSISAGDSGPEILCQAPDPFKVRTIGRKLVK